MNNLVPALVAALLASIMTVGVLEMVRTDDVDGGGPESLSPADQTTLAADEGTYRAMGSQELAGDSSVVQVRDLQMRVADLERRIAALSSTRQPVMTEEMKDAIAGLDDPEARDFVLEVLAQKEEAERLAREAADRQRTEERLLREADRIAQEVGLAAAQKDQLFGVLIEENDRRSQMFELMRNGDFGGGESRDQMREQMQALNDWKLQALTDKMGADVATAIQTFQQENGGNRGMRGMGRTGGGGGGRGGGGGGGGGGRGGGN